MLMTKAATTADSPLMKKNGMIGMNAPTAVESAAEKEEVQGLPKCWADRPSSLWAMAWTICSGSSASRSAIFCDSSTLNPCS